MKAILRNTAGKARFVGPAVVVVVALVLISNLAYAYTTSNLKVLSIQEDRFYNYDFLNEDEVAVFEDFEWGSDGTSLDVEPPPGNVDWTVTKFGYGTASAKIDTSQHRQGTRSAEFYSNYNGWNINAWVLASYPDYRPQRRGFWARTSGVSGVTTTGWVTATGDGQHFLSVRVQLGGRLQYRQDSYLWHDTNPVYKIRPNRWYLIEFRNINWETATYSIYVNNLRVQDGVPMVPGTDWHGLDYNGITSYATDDTYDAGGGSFWIDDLLEYPPSSNGVACAATMVFYNNAWVNKVKNMYYGMADFASWDYAPLNDGNGWIWDQDRGTKTHYPFNNPIYLPDPIDAYVLMHLRVYAPDPPDYMENSAWGKYVIGTTHCDEFPEHPSVPWQTWHGYHEVAEEFFADWAIDDGYTVFQDWTSFYNKEDFRVDVQPDGYICIWENGGDATAVYVP
jgi:hypothetical protein